jgi:hypothetical protein
MPGIRFAGFWPRLNDAHRRVVAKRTDTVLKLKTLDLSGQVAPGGTSPLAETVDSPVPSHNGQSTKRQAFTEMQRHRKQKNT